MPISAFWLVAVMAAMRITIIRGRRCIVWRRGYPFVVLRVPCQVYDFGRALGRLGRGLMVTVMAVAMSRGVRLLDVSRISIRAVLDEHLGYIVVVFMPDVPSRWLLHTIDSTHLAPVWEGASDVFVALRINPFTDGLGHAIHGGGHNTLGDKSPARRTVSMKG